MNERELRALAACDRFPEERDLAPAVRARLQPGGPRRRRALVVVLAAALLAIAVAFAVPPARSGILRFFHLQGATIELVDELPAGADRRSRSTSAIRSPSPRRAGRCASGR